MKFALIVDGRVTELFEAENGDALAERFPPEFGLVHVPEDAAVGWVWDGVTAAPAPPLPPPTRAELAARVAQLRWQAETGGITIAGLSVATDDRSKMMVMGARMIADANPAFTTQWKAGDGFVTIDAPTIIAMSDAIFAHVDACFAAEAELRAKIEADEVTTLDEVDAFAWPG